jgi:DNA-binding HxlR family transcriptional regulator
MFSTAMGHDLGIVRSGADGIVTRTDHKEMPPRVDYGLTPLGRSLAEALVPLCAWGTDNMAEVARTFAERESRRSDTS